MDQSFLPPGGGEDPAVTALTSPYPVEILHMPLQFMPLPIPPIRAVPPSEATPGYNDTSITYWAKTRSIIRTPATVLVLLLLCLHLIQRAEGEESKLVKPMADGRLVMLPWNKQGDIIPDFSFCGYHVRMDGFPMDRFLER